MVRIITYKEVIALFSLMRPCNCVIVFASVLVGAYVTGTWEFSPAVFLAGTSASLIAGGANGLNDFFDVKSDSINKPWRPIPSGQVSKSKAFLFSLSLLSSGLVLAGVLGNKTFLVACVAVALLSLYNLKLGKTVFLGNFAVSLLGGLALIYGGMSLGSSQKAFIPAVFAFLFHLGREIIKDGEDLKGDAALKAETIPILFGMEGMSKTVTAVYSVLIVATILPFLMGLYGWMYLFVVTIGVNPLLLYTIWSIWKDSSAKNLGRVNRMLKYDMPVGLFAILLGNH